MYRDRNKSLLEPKCKGQEQSLLEPKCKGQDQVIVIESKWKGQEYCYYLSPKCKGQKYCRPGSKDRVTNPFICVLTSPGQQIGRMTWKTSCIELEITQVFSIVGTDFEKKSTTKMTRHKGRNWVRLHGKIPGKSSSKIWSNDWEN